MLGKCFARKEKERKKAGKKKKEKGKKEKKKKEKKRQQRPSAAAEIVLIWNFCICVGDVTWEVPFCKCFAGGVLPFAG